MILSPGQTGVMDRYYQCHKNFDLWQTEGRHVVCRIRAGTKKTVLKNHAVKPDSAVFYDAAVLLGTPNINHPQKELCVVNYRVESVECWVATNHHALSAEDVARIYKLYWDIENFFGWWKSHLEVYQLIARSTYGFMVQIRSGLTTYLLLAIYCRQPHQKKVTIKRGRE